MKLSKTAAMRIASAVIIYSIVLISEIFPLVLEASLHRSDKLWTHGSFIGVWTEVCHKFHHGGNVWSGSEGSFIQRQHLFVATVGGREVSGRRRVGSGAWGKYDECAARGIADARRNTSVATVNLHEFIEHRDVAKWVKEGVGRWKIGEKGEEWNDLQLEKNATHFPEEKRQLLFAICARWLYFWSCDSRYSIIDFDIDIGFYMQLPQFTLGVSTSVCIYIYIFIYS